VSHRNSPPASHPPHLSNLRKAEPDERALVLSVSGFLLRLHQAMIAVNDDVTSKLAAWFKRFESCEDESPHSTDLGVFETEAEARSLTDEIRDRFPNGVLHFSWVVGTRYDQGTCYST
jgi:hypothetical protein